MVKVETFLRNKKGQLIQFDEFKDKIKDIRYIEGSIELTVNHVCIIDRSVWDYVYELWAYICLGIETVRKGETFKTYYPDQPIELVFQPLPRGMLKVSCRIRKSVSAAVVEQKLFLDVMSHAAEKFLRYMAENYPKGGSGFLASLQHLNIGPGQKV